MSFSEQLFNVSFHLLRNVSSSAPMADGLFTISPLGLIYIYIKVLFLKEVVSYQFIPKLSIFKANCYLFCLFFCFLFVCLLVFFK